MNILPYVQNMAIQPQEKKGQSSRFPVEIRSNRNRIFKQPILSICYSKRTVIFLVESETLSLIIYISYIKHRKNSCFPNFTFLSSNKYVPSILRHL